MGEWLSLLQTPIPTKVSPRYQKLQPTKVSPRYQKLQKLLAAGNWREADEETARVMLQVAGREKEGWLDWDSIKQFSCEDFRQIDGLWVQYSNGRFGFSVQKRIWQECGGNMERDTYERLGDRVAWQNDEKWFGFGELRFSLNAPAGHLPFVKCLPLHSKLGMYIMDTVPESDWELLQ
nr:GUN4 domain-containing protein [Laspinema sp. D3c]